MTLLQYVPNLMTTCCILKAKSYADLASIGLYFVPQ